MAVLSLPCCVCGLSSSCGARWLLLLRSTGSRGRASVVVARGLRSHGSRALEHRLSSCGTYSEAREVFPNRDEPVYPAWPGL